MDAGIGSSPNASIDAGAPWRVWRLGEHPEMAEEAASEEAYRESMWESVRADGNAIRLYGADALS